ncbi:MAG TPA: hypothetical protein VEF76_08025 [Patescibacteria group bacterium]|nr:hypothetical protein [Patescibacteria group bacterium]
MNTDLQRGYGLPQSRLAAAMAAGGWLEDEERKDKKSEKKPTLSGEKGKGESSPSSRAVADVGEGITDRTDRSA